MVLDGRSLRARADAGAVRCPPRSPHWRARASACASATVARPSLDDVYLRYAGRAFGEADDPK